MRLTWLVAASMLVSQVSFAGFDEGLAAYKSGNYRVAYVELRPLADQGDANAQAFLGFMYEEGKGVTRSYATARSWYEKAAEQGNATAEYQLYLLYSSGGPGLQKDSKKAAAWTMRAAEHGHAKAQYQLGQMYESGTSVPKDDAAALAWTRKAAEQGDDVALVALGHRYVIGSGVQKNALVAYALYYIALRRGSRIADLFLDAAANKLTAQQLKEAQSIAVGWSPGKPLP